MNSNQGFTLLEVIFVLFVWSILITLSVPILFTNIDHHIEKEFFKTLESDILLVQTTSHGTTLNNASIVFNNDSYIVRILGDEDKIMNRNYPAGWKTDGRSFKKISFKNGTIRQPGTILLKSPKDDYRIIFPLGKGRGYVEKQ